mgnify:FL=1
MNKTNALSNLKNLDRIFKSFNVPYWLTDGTLLGYYRDGNFISHDQDTDLGIMFKDFSPSVLKEIQSNDFKIDHVFGYPCDCLEIAISRNGVKTDLFFYYERFDNPDIIYHSAFLKAVNRIDYEYNKFKVKDANFLGHTFNVPENELEFIETKYGVDWKIPDIKWNWAFSPRNHIKTNIVIDLLEQKRQWEKWLKL